VSLSKTGRDVTSASELWNGEAVRPEDPNDVGLLEVLEDFGHGQVLEKGNIFYQISSRNGRYLPGRAD